MTARRSATARPTWPPIGLAELTERAALQTRVDRKYVLPSREWRRCSPRSAGHARVLEIDGMRSFRYESIYFDTPDLTSYRLTAHRRRRRFKVRTRTYLDSAPVLAGGQDPGRRGAARSRAACPTRSTTAPTSPRGRTFVDEVLAPAVVPVGRRLRLRPTLSPATGAARCSCPTGAAGSPSTPA